jgi:hydrogenase expression/formation protein HypD
VKERNDLRTLTKAIFRDKILAAETVHLINTCWNLLRKNGIDEVKIMNFCGTHEYTTSHYGIRNLLPAWVEIIPGPGCPVCITPSYYVESAVKLALEGVVIYTYGDAYRLPAVRPVNRCRSLADARVLGADVRVVYSFLDAIVDAAKHSMPSAFFGVGFETTYPAYASAIVNARIPQKLSLITAGRLTPPAARYSVERVGHVSGVIAPGHVSTIIGAKPWAFLTEEFNIPTVVAGFEPIDILIAILIILRQLLERKAWLTIEYSRTVSWEGNLKARNLIDRAFDTVDAAWRGIGFIENSGYKLREGFNQYDAFTTYGLSEPTVNEWKHDLLPGCLCGQVIIGKVKPTECKMFMKQCTPATPYGPCMVSYEGACSIWARHGGRKTLAAVA